MKELRRSGPVLRFAVGIIFGICLEEYLSGKLYVFLTDPCMNPGEDNLISED